MRKGFAIITGAAALGAVITAFVGAGSRPAAAAGPALERFGTCEGFLHHVRRNALQLVGPYGLDAGGPVPLPVAAAETTVDEAAAAEPEQDGASTIFSTTNVQEAGVDEPDLVKTDGSRIFAISGGTLYAVDVSGPEPRLVGSVALARQSGADQLFLHGDRLVVLSAPQYVIFEDAATEIAPSQPLSTTLTEIDVGDAAAMRVVRTFTVEGNLIAARLIGSSARVVVASGPTGLEFVYPDGTFAEAQAERVNRQVIAESGVLNWVPSYRLENVESGAVVTRRAVDCREVARPPRFSGLGLLTVLTFDLDRGLQAIDSDAVFAGGETAYASAAALYVATQRWLDTGGGALPGGVTTEIHRFDTSIPGRTEYRSSGSVRGFLIGQFAMSEHKGFLRVASTEDPPWWGDSTLDAGESRVTILTERAGLLEQVGAVTGLGKGERIYAVRFLGDVGYVVTFRQVDPLYTIDLSDPTSPRVAGELKITGYSSYLHPVGDGLLLGIGQDATLEGQVLGTQVSLFDVTDPASPTLLDRRSLATGWSEAEYDHHAFLHWAKTGLTVLPIQGSRVDPQTGLVIDSAGAVGLRVGAGTLESIGLVEHPGGQIRRSLVVGDVLYTVSDTGLKASDLTTLADENWVPFV